MTGGPSPQLGESKGADRREECTALEPKQLAGFLKRLPVRRVVHLPNVTRDPVQLQVPVHPP